MNSANWRMFIFHAVASIIGIVHGNILVTLYADDPCEIRMYLGIRLQCLSGIDDSEHRLDRLCGWLVVLTGDSDVFLDHVPSFLVMEDRAILIALLPVKLFKGYRSGINRRRGANDFLRIATFPIPFVEPFLGRDQGGENRPFIVDREMGLMPISCLRKSGWTLTPLIYAVGSS